jgi:hypothetical protein
MSHAILLPAAVLLIGFVAATAFQLPATLAARRTAESVDVGTA